MAQDISGRRKKLRFPPWLPVVASVVLMVMVAFVAAKNAKHLDKAAQWSSHSADVIIAEQSFQNNLLDIQRGLRGYITLGDTNALASYYNNAGTEHLHLEELSSLTFDNPAQQERLKNLGTAVAALLAFDRRAIAIYQQQGFLGISKLDSTGEGRTVFGRAQDTLSQFSADEQRLWNIRDATQQNDYYDVGRLLVGGSVLAVVLLLVAAYLTNRELSFRRKVEARLKHTLLLQNAILNAADYGIATTDPEGLVQTFNPAAERLLGYTAEEVIGKATPMLWRDALEIAERATNLSKKLGIPVRPTFEAVTKKVESEGVDEAEWTFIRKNGSRFPCLLVVTALDSEKGKSTGFLGVFRDISERKKSDMERERLIAELKTTLAHVKTLSGLIPICAWCKNVRSDTGYWQTVEQYVRVHTDVSFSHGVCPSCAAKFKEEILRANQKSQSVDTLFASKA